MVFVFCTSWSNLMCVMENYYFNKSYTHLNKWTHKYINTRNIYKKNLKKTAKIGCILHSAWF